MTPDPAAALTAAACAGILAAIGCRCYMPCPNSAPLPVPAILYRMAGLCLSLVVLGGCASATNDMTHSRLHPPIRILLAESAPTLQAARLQKVFAPDVKTRLTLADAPLAGAVRHAQHYALASMEKQLQRQPDISLISPTPTSQTLLDSLRGPGPAHALNQHSAKQLHELTGADAVLRFDISDYGLTPKSWRSSYITFEVVTTLGITAVIASVGGTVAKGAAGAYLAQEAVEETAEGYAGFWALDEVCRPVRIEAELIRLEPPAVIWQYSDTGLANVHVSRLYRDIGAAERNRQLDQSTGYAVQDLLNILRHDLHGKRIAQSPAHLKWELN